ncbi:MAG: hypothetical protein Q8830_03125, partial [Candidatus Phytoplasma australasiaticum]|nr:hypothetical protein [Candidatus Phytoplasma australasiaticum]
INDLETVSNGLQQSCVAFVLSCFSILMIIFIQSTSRLRDCVGDSSAIKILEVVGIVMDELTYEKIQWRSYVNMSEDRLIMMWCLLRPFGRFV